MATVATDVANEAYLVRVTGLGYVESNPPVVEPPAALRRGHSYVKAFAYPEPVVTDGRVILDPTWVEAKAHRNRIIVGGKDVTFFHEVPTPFPSFRLTQPHGYGATTLVFPQTHAAFERFGQGALAWLDKEKRVRFQRIDVETGAGAGIDYMGVITAVRVQTVSLDGASKLCWVADVGGEVSGRASLRDQQPPLFRWVRDIQRHVHDSVRSLRLRVRENPDVGIMLARQGGMSQLDWLNHLCAMAVKKDGTHYTLMPAADNERVWEFRPKDTTTRHATVYFDSGNIVPDLVNDIAETPNMIYGTGVTPEGMKVKNGRYPGLKQADAPAYPFADNRTFSVGDSLSGATAGSIEAMNWRLIGAKYLDQRDDVATFTDATAAAVEALQDDAGLPVTGDMDPATWDALFDLSVTGYSLRQSQIEPMAQATHVKKWNRTPSGARSTRNTDYDPTRLQVHRTIDFGSGHEKSTMLRWARQERIRSIGNNWVGTIKVNTGAVIRGEHVPGAPVEAVRYINGGSPTSKPTVTIDGGSPSSVVTSTLDGNSSGGTTGVDPVFGLMHFRELRPGMNLWAPLFNGGTLFHIVGIDVDEGGKTGTLTVDTKCRDLLTVAEIIQRNRDSRRDPARAYLNQNRKRGQIDSVITFDEVGGLVFDKITCPANEWTVWPVVAGQEGTIRKLAVQTTGAPAAYCLSVWGAEVGAVGLNAALPNPLAIDADRKTVWMKGLDIFKEKILLYSVGDEEQPCGYAPGKYTNDVGDVTNDPITGLWEDDSQFSYHTGTHPVLWVAIWPTVATTIEPQRIMWPQLEEGQ